MSNHPEYQQLKKRVEIHEEKLAKNEPVTTWKTIDYNREKVMVEIMEGKRPGYRLSYYEGQLCGYEY